MLLQILFLCCLTCLPLLELRASIPYGFFSACKDVVPWYWVSLICITANVFVGMAVFEILLPTLVWVRNHWAWFNDKFWPHIAKRQEKLRPSVEKYGEWGLAIFIGVPLPGTGAFSGALGAFLLGFSRKRFYLANLLGVLIAGICVTVICWLLMNGLVADDSFIKKLMIKDIS